MISIEKCNELIWKTGLSRRDLANRLKVSETTLVAWLEHKKVIPPDRLELFEKLVGEDLKVLFCCGVKPQELKLLSNKGNQDVAKTSGTLEKGGKRKPQRKTEGPGRIRRAVPKGGR